MRNTISLPESNSSNGNTQKEQIYMYIFILFEHLGQTRKRRMSKAIKDWGWMRVRNDGS